jgi:hypothetical protein
MVAVDPKYVASIPALTVVLYLSARENVCRPPFPLLTARGLQEELESSRNDLQACLSELGHVLEFRHRVDNLWLIRRLQRSRRYHTESRLVSYIYWYMYLYRTS